MVAAMADEEPRTEEPAQDPELEDEELASTPFDSPWFVPVLLWAGAAWFGYDIVTNAEAYQEWPNFNRGGFAVLSVAAVYTTWRAYRERSAPSGDEPSPSDS
jgi:hypothetical protein